MFNLYNRRTIYGKEDIIQPVYQPCGTNHFGIFLHICRNR
ncbi:MAG: hypothetical protein QG635_793, partial [Bacteroidota bacterium]|nr:hypothetical protein [Bacteroidota bacterium]